jgi:hypothetical protein
LSKEFVPDGNGNVRGIRVCYSLAIYLTFRPFVSIGIRMRRACGPILKFQIRRSSSLQILCS